MVKKIIFLVCLIFLCSVLGYASDTATIGISIYIPPQLGLEAENSLESADSGSGQQVLLVSSKTETSQEVLSDQNLQIRQGQKIMVRAVLVR
jgi:hypothetical protein